MKELMGTTTTTTKPFSPNQDRLEMKLHEPKKQGQNKSEKEGEK
jgi:hypothetical protein